MNEVLKQKIISHYLSIGPERFFQWLVLYASEQIELGAAPQLDLLNRANQFFQLYKRKKDELYRDLAFIFRRAANKIYRQMLKKKLTDKNRKFFNLVG